MINLNLRTAKGRKIDAMGVACKGYNLEDIYKTTWSNAKTEAMKRCMNMCEADNGVCFRVGNANSFGFTATWLYKKGNVWYRRVETKDNSYIVEQN